MTAATPPTQPLSDPFQRDGASLFARLWRNRELVFVLVKRDLKIRYKESTLGFLWSFGRPLLLMLVIWGVFSHLVGVPSSHPMLPYSLHLLTALLPWMFMGSVASESLYAVVGNSNVVKKVWIPAEVFPAANVVGQLVHLMLAFVVLGAFLLSYAVFGVIPEGQPDAGARLGFLVLPSWEAILLPFLILLQAAFLFGLALVLSSLNVFYRDMASITEIGLSAWFYLTPIIYPANAAREQFKAMGYEFAYWIWLCNPMTPITLAYRRLFFGNLFRNAPEVSDGTLLLGLGLASVEVAALLAFGVWLFRRKSPRFADEL